MGRASAVDQISKLLATADEAAATVNTSMRLPENLRAAAAIAVEELGAAPSTTMLTVAALRRALETIAMESALGAHYDEHPEVRPSIVDVALALAAQDGSPLAGRPELIAAAAAAVLARRRDADADDVLLWAEAQLAVTG